MNIAGLFYFLLLKSLEQKYNGACHKGKKMAERNKIMSFYLASVMVSLILAAGCRKDGFSASSEPAQEQNQSQQAQSTPPQDLHKTIHPTTAVWTHPRSDQRLDDRKRMVNLLEHHYGLNDKKVLDAMLNVPRHWFVPDALQSAAYADGPLLIGQGQTISQPFIVAYMTRLLELDPNDVVLEVGTGSGYQAAVLSEFTPHVFSIEILKPLADAAALRLRQRGYTTVRVKYGDGYLGWPEHAPFDAIIVTCAPDQIPAPLLEQLAPDGRIAIPVGDEWGVQELLFITKNPQGKITKKSMMPVRFVPLIREKP
jgi:protein-L-isoaspartate(D-aspartate) O-methyltransferase